MTAPYTTPAEAPPSASSYVVNSRIIVVAVAVLFAVVLFILCLHVYAKWFWRSRGETIAAPGGRALSWRRRRRYGAQSENPSPEQVGVGPEQSVGLDRSIVESLPTFEYKTAAMEQGRPLECAVCLEEFEEKERGRTLPKCGHDFHLECIDMWLHSHSTCPLCRASVRPDEENVKSVQPEAAANVDRPDDAVATAAQLVGYAQAPFADTMRASTRSMGGSSLPIGMQEVAETQELHGGGDTEEAPTSQRHGQELPAGEQKTAAPKCTEIPSNVLFWGGAQTHIMGTLPAQPGAEPTRSSAGLGAPFQVAIDIPRTHGTAAAADASSPFASLRSPIARASASFRRLLTRGNGVAGSPQSQGGDHLGEHQQKDDEEDGGGGPSSRPPPTV